MLNPSNAESDSSPPPPAGAERRAGAPDSTGRRQVDALRSGENRILEMIVHGAPLPDTLCELARMMESQTSGTLCAVLLVDAEAQCLRPCAAPGFPPEFAEAVNGIPMIEGAGPCGTAAARRQVVVVTDVRTDPLATGYRVLAERIGVRAVWSAPVLSREETVLATFAMYASEARGPTPEERQLIDFASQIAGIAIQRTRAEEALRQAEEKYRKIFEHAPDGIFQITPQGRILDANPAFAQLFGYASSAALRADVQDVGRQLCLDPGRYAEFVEALHARGLVHRWELPMRHRERGVLWVSIDARLAPAADGQTHCYEGFAEDISERKRLEQQFLQSQKMEAFGQLAGGVAHDFNNLLTVILGNLSLIRLGGVSALQGQRAIEDCLRAAQRAASVTSQLLTFSRRQPVEPQDLDLNEVVANLTKMLQPVIGEHITLEVTPAAGGAPVRADPGMMEQALMNLALNARDAMPKGGKLHVTTAVVTLDVGADWAATKRRAGRFVRLTVADTGVGIGPEHLPHIFEPFYTTKEVGKGTGLGLATVFGIVAQHDGWIDVESAPGRGTSIHVFLPWSDSGERPKAAGAAGPVRPRGGSETILLAEDEDDVRGLMLKLLERHGYRVHAAANGEAALEIWRAHRAEIDLLITDMVMPGGVGGRELGDRVLADKPGLRVLYCSGYTDEMLGGDLPLRRGANFLEKPFDVHVFLGRVRACLDA